MKTDSKILKVIAKNADENHIIFTYDTVDELREIFWSNDINMNVPSNDDEIISCEFAGTKMHFDTFYDLIKAFNIDCL